MCCYRASTITPSTSRPPGRDPLLWLKLADVAIMSKAWAEEHNVTKAVVTNPVPRSPLPVRRENVIFCRHYRMARVPALGAAAHGA